MEGNSILLYSWQRIRAWTQPLSICAFTGFSIKTSTSPYRRFLSTSPKITPSLLQPRSCYNNTQKAHIILVNMSWSKLSISMSSKKAPSLLFKLSWTPTILWWFVSMSVYNWMWLFIISDMVQSTTCWKSALLNNIFFIVILKKLEGSGNFTMFFSLRAQFWNWGNFGRYFGKTTCMRLRISKENYSATKTVWRLFVI